MTHAYEDTYLAEAMNNLGDMFDYAINTLGHEPDQFYSKFIISRMANQFGHGNPKYVAGLSGPELALRVLHKTGCEVVDIPSPPVSTEQTPEFWAGRALAYYQWFTTRTFSYMRGHGLTFARILPLYSTLHASDLSAFVEAADHIINESLCSVRKVQLCKYKRLKSAIHLYSSALCKELIGRCTPPAQPENNA